MNQTESRKLTTIQIIRIFSIGLGVCYTIAAGLFLIDGIQTLRTYCSNPELLQDIPSVLHLVLNYSILLVTLIPAAVLFFRLAKEAIPFQKKNVRMIRIIAAAFFLFLIIPTLIAACLMKEPAMMFTILTYLPNVLSILVLLMFAQILHYGTMLQQESDETL